ncbi:MAG: hypothetical protein ACLFWG_04160 [Longimicrobiales bacterium]
MTRTLPPICVWLLVLSVVGAFSGCSSITSVDPSSLDFTVEQIRPGSEEPIPDLGATGGDGEIRFQGAVGTPVPCYDVEGEVALQENTVILEVVATRREMVCIQVLATFGYDGIVTDVDPGFYQVEIAHVQGGVREVVFEGAVEVE